MPCIWAFTISLPRIDYSCTLLECSKLNNIVALIFVGDEEMVFQSTADKLQRLLEIKCDTILY